MDKFIAEIYDYYISERASIYNDLFKLTGIINYSENLRQLLGSQIVNKTCVKQAMQNPVVPMFLDNKFGHYPVTADLIMLLIC